MTDFIRTDVTAVKLIKKYIFAGIGSAVHVFDRETLKLVREIKVLSGQKIYGIIPSDCQSKILIYGGKQLSILDLFDNVNYIISKKPIICDDWLHSGIWLNNDEVAILTAHNTVQIWNIRTSSVKAKHEGKHNSILYSGLLLKLNDDVLVFSGTVYSEVIIQTVSEGPLHYLKGHKGVIFSIACDILKGLIVTTSDDRSVRIWEIQNPNNLNHSKYKDYWKSVKIHCLHELYGHTARVMKSYISDDCIISVGEDSGICFWSIDGTLLRKITSHQNGSIWSLDADDKHLVTGGGDCAVILHPLSLKDEYIDIEIIKIDVKTPKQIEFTARRNIVIVNESNDLVYYDFFLKNVSIQKLNHESTYKMLGISSCKQIIAVLDINGNIEIFIENCKGAAELQKLISTKLKIGKVLSMQWAGNRHLVFCSESGTISIAAAKNMDIEILGTYVLPPCKERWLTASALSIDNILIVGDRCGNIHIYNKESSNPIETFNKVHGRYGATSINIRGNEVITTGRDGTVKYFLKSNNNIKYMSCKNLEFQWVEKFIDKNNTYICGFQERIFVVYDMCNNAKLLEVSCGGGHRSWDVVRFIDKQNDHFDEVIKLVYVKNSVIYLNTFQMSKIVSKNVIHSTHSKAINCLKTIKSITDESATFFISGGEDTTLRICKLDSNKHFRDDLIFKHLSSIKTVKITHIDVNRILLISGGGRAQICAKMLSFDNSDDNLKVVSEEIADYLIKGTDKERKGNRSWKSVSVDFDPETRVMDLEVIRRNYGFSIYAACSDTFLRIFDLNNENQLKLLKTVKHHQTCILKTHSMTFNNIQLLVTCTTRGDISFWNVFEPDIEHLYSTRTNKSGINCITSTVTAENQFLIATGGDDNAIHVMLMENDDSTSLKDISKWTSSKFHSSQITGLVFVDDLLVSTSIDQRVTLLQWSVNNGEINCDFLSQTFSNVADIHGMDLLKYNGWSGNETRVHLILSGQQRPSIKTSLSKELYLCVFLNQISSLEYYQLSN